MIFYDGCKKESACIATVIYNNLRYQNHTILENGYGIDYIVLLIMQMIYMHVVIMPLIHLLRQ